MHSCHAINCKTEIEPKLFMCYKHWKMVPKKLQISIWNEYRPGQEIDKNPSIRYMAVQQFAVGEVADKEGYEDEAQIAYKSAAKFALLWKQADEKANQK